MNLKKVKMTYIVISLILLLCYCGWLTIHLSRTQNAILQYTDLNSEALTQVGVALDKVSTALDEVEEEMSNHIKAVKQDGILADQKLLSDILTISGEIRVDLLNTTHKTNLEIKALKLSVDNALGNRIKY